jgi:hypothetical protein
MTRVDEAARNRLYNEIAEKLDEGETLMQLLPTSQWNDLVSKDHLDARFAQVDARFAEVGARFAEVNARFSQVDAKIERSTRTVIVWVVGAMFAFNGLLAAIVNASH